MHHEIATALRNARRDLADGEIALQQRAAELLDTFEHANGDTPSPAERKMIAGAVQMLVADPCFGDLLHRNVQRKRLIASLDRDKAAQMLGAERPATIGG